MRPWSENERKNPTPTNPGDKYDVKAPLNLSEGVAYKFDLVLANYDYADCGLDSKIED